MRKASQLRAGETLRLANGIRAKVIEAEPYTDQLTKLTVQLTVPKESRPTWMIVPNDDTYEISAPALAVVR
jgi:hypothetical protein